LQVPRRHVPATQLTAALGKLHALPHVPQLVALVRTLVSQPLLAIMSQFSNPDRHDPSEHIPFEHVPVALANSQRVPHVPQLVGSDTVETHVPPQSVCPVGQMIWHRPTPASPATHPCPTGHTTPHAPQFCGVFIGTHAPLHSIDPMPHGAHIPPTHERPGLQLRAPASLPPAGAAQHR
jgi:hypothetical protein